MSCHKAVVAERRLATVGCVDEELTTSDVCQCSVQQAGEWQASPSFLIGGQLFLYVHLARLWRYKALDMFRGHPPPSPFGVTWRHRTCHMWFPVGGHKSSLCGYGVMEPQRFWGNGLEVWLTWRHWSYDHWIGRPQTPSRNKKEVDRMGDCGYMAIWLHMPTTSSHDSLPSAENVLSHTPVHTHGTIFPMNQVRLPPTWQLLKNSWRHFLILRDGLILSVCLRTRSMSWWWLEVHR